LWRRLFFSLTTRCHFEEKEKIIMGTYDWQQLIQRWQRGEMSTEQAIGQLILQVQVLSERVGRLEVEFEAKRRNKKPNSG
jgi:hypothetical protein